ncbi:MAG: tRNA 2-thiouridine(34) synthase MnmA [Candidatus Pelagibacter sp.]|nr:tRNA 2-thiouridine(34) synthase MnmA [Candidatus Pelagibacter sp.]
MINSLGINKKPKDTKVVVAMSGGVDSSVVAGLMKQGGYDVTGITLKLYDDLKKSKTGRQCCAGQDILDAKRVSSQLDIKHEILYYQKKFKNEVINSFINSYVNGETPIPCVQCNQTVKFRDLFEYAKSIKADVLVTGHYVKRIQRNKKAHLYRAKDISRDQSYFLFGTTQEQLNFLRFPLGEIEKSETRDIALTLKLNVADKPDSQDICFVPNGNYSSVIKKFRPKSFTKGDILDLTGKKLGSHEGIINYTIGQRRGIKIAGEEPLYVVGINPDKNSITVGSRKNLIINKIELRSLNILSDKIEFNEEINMKIRSTGKLLKGKVTFLNEKALVEILDEETGISPGQACVFYKKDFNGDKLLGGGWIDKTFNENLST